MRAFIFGVALVVVAAAASTAEAACHAVTLSGSGTQDGSSWSNAMANLPATLVRGDTYFLGDGSGYRLQGIDPASGSTVTSVKKAVPTAATGSAATAHCVDTGWNDATLGSGQAIFVGSPAVDLSAFAYFVLDGQVRTSLSSGHGIKLDSSACTNTQCYTLLLGFNAGAKASHITVQYTEFSQSNPNGTTNFDQDYGVYAYANDQTAHASALTDITLQYNYHHHSACDFIFTRNVANFTVQNSYFFKNSGGTACHGQDWEDNNSVNLTARYNVFDNSHGTATLVVLSDGFAVTTSGWYVYGNVFYDYPGGDGWNANGTVACINTGITCDNMVVYNNTFANQQNTVAGAGSNVAGITVQQATASPVCQNNLFYNVDSSVSLQLNCATEDYNSIVFSGARAGTLAGAHDVVDTANTNLFAAALTTPPAAADFHLLAENSPDYAGGAVLVAPYDRDPDGNARGADGTWERGAYEFCADGGCVRPDAGSIPDAGASGDAGSGADAGTGTTDAGGAPDGGSALDSGVKVDGGAGQATGSCGCTGSGVGAEAGAGLGLLVAARLRRRRARG